MAIRAALCDTRVPRTHGVEYRTNAKPKGGEKAGGDMDVDTETRSGFDTRAQAFTQIHAGDFELVDYWDEGEVLEGRERWPVGVVLNLVSHFCYFCLGSAPLPLFLSRVHEMCSD